MMPGANMAGTFFGGFQIFFVLFLIIFLLVFGVIIATLFRGIARERRNDRAPKLTVLAKVVSKRTHFRHRAGKHSVHGYGYTTYYAAFEMESGDRMELLIPENEFGLLVEGDRGNLTFQGTRFLRFERRVDAYDL